MASRIALQSGGGVVTLQSGGGSISLQSDAGLVGGMVRYPLPPTAKWKYGRWQEPGTWNTPLTTAAGGGVFVPIIGGGPGCQLAGGRGLAG